MNGQFFPTIGICSKLGTRNVTIISFGVGAVVGGLMGYLVSNIPEFQNKRILFVIGGALGVGVLAAIGAYFTCSGVEYGLPVRKK